MIETRRLKNVVILIQTVLRFVLSRKIRIRLACTSLNCWYFSNKSYLIDLPMHAIARGLFSTRSNNYDGTFL